MCFKNLHKKLKEPKNKLRYFSLAAYAILFAAWFALDFKILYLVMGLFIILAARIWFMFQLAKEMDKKAKAKKKTRKKKKS